MSEGAGPFEESREEVRLEGLVLASEGLLTTHVSWPVLAAFNSFSVASKAD